MVRVVSGLCATMALAAMGFAFGALALAALPNPPAPFDEPARAPAVEPVVVSARDVPEVWPTVFGTVPEVAPEPVAAPDPVVAPEPEPERNNTYLLTGIIAGADLESFAMISENDGGVVVRVGDVLVGGETVTAIDARGVWIEYDGVRELIAAPQTDFGTMVTIDPSSAAETAPLASEVIVEIETLERAAIEELITAAGRYELRNEDGTTGLELLSIRKGWLFDQIGLRAGDTIVAVNGNTLQSPDILADTPETDLLRGALEFEILRDGARQTVKVTFDQS